MNFTFDMCSNTLLRTYGSKAQKQKAFPSAFGIEDDVWEKLDDNQQSWCKRIFRLTIFYPLSKMVIVENQNETY